MNPETFGALALQLFGASTIPAASLDEALLFRQTAQDLAAGRLGFAEAGAAVMTLDKAETPSE